MRKFNLLVFLVPVALGLAACSKSDTTSSSSGGTTTASAQLNWDQGNWNQTNWQ